MKDFINEMFRFSLEIYIFHFSVKLEAFNCSKSRKETKVELENIVTFFGQKEKFEKANTITIKQLRASPATSLLPHLEVLPPPKGLKAEMQQLRNVINSPLAIVTHWVWRVLGSSESV